MDTTTCLHTFSFKSDVILPISTNIASAVIIAILIFIISVLADKWSITRLLKWWFGSHTSMSMPIKSRFTLRNVFRWHEAIPHAIDLVTNSLMISRTFQGSPIGMPLATCSKEFYQYTMYMVWLILQPQPHSVYERIRLQHYDRHNERYYISSNRQKFDAEWKTPLLQSYENDESQIMLMSYNDFMYIYQKELYER